MSFPFSLKNFIIFHHAHLLKRMKHLSVGTCLYFTYNFEGIFSGYGILGWQFCLFSYSARKMLFPYLRACIIADKRTVVILIVSPVCNVSFYFSVCFQNVFKCSFLCIYSVSVCWVPCNHGIVFHPLRKSFSLFKCFFWLILSFPPRAPVTQMLVHLTIEFTFF